jgi:DNA adenine methylase
MFSYIGGKSKIGKWIREFIPTEIKTYVEPFSGAFWVYYNMDLEKYTKLERVVYNDFNKVNANLFACVKQYKEFFEYIKDIPAQERERFVEYQKGAFTDFDFDPENPNFQRGLEYIYVVTQVFSGIRPETSNFVDLKGKYNSKFNAFRNKLNNPKFFNHFDKITHVRNMDFEEIVKEFDDVDTYYYLDPPYWKTENYYSNQDFDRADHDRLANTLQNIKGLFSLSYYHFEELEDLYPRDTFVWTSKDYAKSAGAVAGKKQNKASELLIMNYGVNEYKGQDYVGNSEERI